MTAKLYSPSAIVVVDPAEPRRRAAESLGATPIDPAANDPVEVVRARHRRPRRGRGAGGGRDPGDVRAVHASSSGPAVTSPTSACTASRRRCTWSRCGSATSPSPPGLVDTRTTPTLLRLLAAGQLDVSSLVTHRFRMDDFLDAYDVFADPAPSGALKVLVTAD